MGFEKFLKTLGPVAMMAIAAGAAGRDRGEKFRWNGKEGVKLADLDLSGDMPRDVNLVGPDIVRITRGDDFTIALEGSDEAKDRMRFHYEKGTLSILREGLTGNGSSPATITVTMPAPRKLVLAGSGTIEAEDIAVDSLDIHIAGSGTCRASGRAEELEVTIAGSGDAELALLMVEEAEITIMGSGDVTFASDGKVDAKIMGSGNITVRGSARCKVKSLGSGTLICERETPEKNKRRKQGS